MPFTYEYPRPMVTVDVILFAWIQDDLSVLLIKRRRPPHQRKWAVPGGFVEEHEALEDAARRELAEETGLRRVRLEQLYTFGDPKRDPRGRVITVTYLALVRPEQFLGKTRAGDDAGELRWYSVSRLPRLAFDHSKIIACAHERLRNKLEYTTAGFGLLSGKFTLSELQRVYEGILGKKLDKRNFRKKMLSLRILRALRESKREGRHRPAYLYMLAEKRFEKLKDRGIIFPF